MNGSQPGTNGGDRRQVDWEDIGRRQEVVGRALAAHQELSPESAPGRGPIHPSRAARPMIPTVAYRLSPAA